MTAASEPATGLNRSQTHSAVAKAALSGAGVATVGLVVLLIGYAAKWKGYGNDGSSDNSASVSDIFFFMFAIGGTVAVICAIVLLVRERHSGWGADRTAGLRVLIGFAAAVVAIALVSTIF
jgi:hypothetical protein